MARQPGVPQPSSRVPDVWSTYLATDDARKTVGAVAANGGQVPRRPHGRRRPRHDGFGQRPRRRGDRRVAVRASIRDSGSSGSLGRRPGSSCTLRTTRPPWTSTATCSAGHPCHQRHAGVPPHDARLWRSQLAGIMDATGFFPDTVPAHWSIYFGVDDTDAALANIVELGGSVRMAAEDTPYGRIAAATDPAGAVQACRRHMTSCVRPRNPHRRNRSVCSGCKPHASQER